MNKDLLTNPTKPTETVQATRLTELRQVILNWLMGIILVFGSIMAFVNSGQFIDAKNYLFLFVSWGAIVYLGIIYALGYYGKASYLLRAISSVALTYLIAVLAFDNFGLVGDARSWLILFVVLSTVMLGRRASIIANLITVATYIGAGYLIISREIIVKELIGYDYSLATESWITAGVTTLFVNLVLSAAVTALLRGLDNSLSDLESSFEESTELSNELANEHSRLERRSEALEHRLTQIRTAAEITKTMGAILDPNELMDQVANLVQSRFDLYYVGIFTVDERRRYANLAAGSGEAGKNMLAENHQLAVGGSSMVGWATAHGEPRISLNVDQESIRFRNPHLPLTRSELALPIAISGQTIGALSVQSTLPEAFDDDDITMLQSISDSLGIALDNARLFQKFEHSLGEIQQLNRRYLAESWSNIWAEQDFTSDREFDTAADGYSEDTPEVNIPLVLRGDQVIGNISFATEQTDLSADDKEFLEAITTQAALALESARLLDEANKRVEQERALRNLTSQFSQSLDFETLLQTIVKEVGQIPLVKEASIHVSPPKKPGAENGDSQPSAPEPPPPQTDNDLEISE
jgi:GAF domain-containing protein